MFYCVGMKNKYTYVKLGNKLFRNVLVHSYNITDQNYICGEFQEETMGRDSSVGIATRYGLDGPGIESRLGRDFPHPSRPAPGPTQPPIRWVPGLSQG